VAAALTDRPQDIERAAALGLAAGRIAIGAGLWLAPELTLRALGFSEADDRVVAVARIAGTRDIVLGAWQATTLGSRDRLGRATVAVTACDAGDSLAFALLLGTSERRAGLRGLAGAVPATIVGLALAGRLRSRAEILVTST
jgi:hypothetical protein